MTIDMEQFHQVFFEESFEGLDVMETGLLNLSPGTADMEEINTIFRAAHSIKGGSGTFGFMDVSAFTHVMETLLDEMRDGRRQVEQRGVNVLLGSVDCLREMLAAIQSGADVDADSVNQHQKELEVELNGGDGGAANEPEEVAVEQAEQPVVSSVKPGWHIIFCPHAHLMKTGNDPVRMFRELEELGNLIVEADFRGLPEIQDIDPEECHLSWDIRLEGEIERQEIDEVFDWVEDDCDMTIISFADEAGKSTTTVVEKAVSIESATEKPDEPPSTKAASQAAPKPATAAKQPNKKPAAKPASASIRVDTAKIDSLINMVGELVITQSMLSSLGDNFDMTRLDLLQSGLSQLESHTRELQQSAMGIRMMPISFVFSRFPRLVHDLSSKMGKQIELKLSGENTEVDKTVIELISDPLVHLVRNSLDHGVEMPDERVAAGKPALGTVHLNAFHRGGNIVIEVTDDGNGLDGDKLFNKAVEKGVIEADAILTEKEKFDLIFAAGFSTAEVVSDVSGRGVGMDVVRKNIEALGGHVEIRSKLGKGSTFAIYLPLTLAILDGQSVAVGDETYIVPLGSIIESFNLRSEMISHVAGRGETFRLRDEYLPILRMQKLFGVESSGTEDSSDGLLVVVEGQGTRCGLLVDDLLGQQQVVIKSLETNYRNIEGISAATILGDGSVGLILDIPGLLRLAKR
ncbi:MAG: chemotaxis protein CheA [Gammaproteobacteria bacterium]|nr:MAG: chemotaxis protein CheA [Gammaproteobacteria bacterium]